MQEMTDVEEVRCPKCNSPIVLVPAEGAPEWWEPDCRCHPSKFTLPQEFVPVGNPAAEVLFLYRKK